MLKIRLQRTGKRGQAYFRIVVLEHTKKTKGGFLELLGSYNPHEKQFSVQKDRIEYWLAQGAQISPTVNNLMTNFKVWDKPKMQSWKPKKKETPQAPAPVAASNKETPAETPEPVSESPAEPAPETAASTS